MSIDKMREGLSRKLDSLESFKQMLADTGIYPTSYRMHEFVRAGFPNQKGWNRGDFHRPSGITYLPAYVFGAALHEHASDIWPEAHWWLLRDHMRLTYGVYEPITDALMEWLGDANHLHFQHAFHMSKTDPGMIAYTVSMTDGLADRKMKVAPGKLIRKFYPSLLDAEVQRIEAAHRAETNDEIEFVTGQAEIQKVYTSMVGDSGCMRYKPDNWSLPKNLHPSAIYDAPGFSVAVHRNANGDVTARTVCWVNPDDENDKRYIRLYGDGVLKRKLERRGFVMRNLMGARLKKIPNPNYPGAYIMAYIDGPGGNTESHRDGRWAKLDGDYIKLISKEEYLQICDCDGTGRMAASCDTTAGYVYLSPIPDDLFNYTCSITGALVNKLEERPTEAFNATGELVTNVRPSAVASWDHAFGEGASWRAAHPDAPRFTHDGDPWIDTPAVRSYLGYCRLSAKFYPEEQDWQQHVADWTALADGSYIKDSDAVSVVNADGSVEVTHSSVLTDDHVKLYSRGRDINAWAAPGVEYYRTSNGYKVHPKTHDIAQAWDGSWDFKRNLQRLTVMGKEVYYRTGEAVPTIDRMPVLAARVRTNLEFVFSECQRLGYDTDRIKDGVRRSLMYTIAAYPTKPSTNVSWRWTNIAGSTVTFDHVRQAYTDRLQASFSTPDDESRTRNGLWMIEQAAAFLDEKFPPVAPVAPAPAPVAEDRFQVAA